MATILFAGTTVQRLRVACSRQMPQAGGGGGGGGTLKFSYIRRLGSFFCVQNFEFQYFGFSKKENNVFLGMNILRIFFWGSSQNWTIFRGNSYAF